MQPKLAFSLSNQLPDIPALQATVKLRDICSTKVLHIIKDIRYISYGRHFVWIKAYETIKKVALQVIDTPLYVEFDLVEYINAATTLVPHYLCMFVQLFAFVLFLNQYALYVL